MEYPFIKVLIVDDEPLIRNGIRYLIDWESLGFWICGDAEDGETALSLILKYQPDLILLDICMPKMYGTDFMRLARAQGFTGEFIVLSGYSDFQYAQAALRYNAAFYLSKPIDEKNLEEAVLIVKERIDKKHSQNIALSQYKKNAKTTVLFKLFTEGAYDSSINYAAFDLYAPIYQVIIYEAYTPFFAAYNFADLLKVTNQNDQSFEQITIENRNIILLKGDFALDRFHNCLRHYEEGLQKGSPLDSIFMTYSPVIPRLADARNAYLTCLALLERRFFCEENQHVLSPDDLPNKAELIISLNHQLVQEYGTKLTDYLQTLNRKLIYQTLTELQNNLFHCTGSVAEIRYFLIDIFLQIKQNIMRNYDELEGIPFTHNAAIIELIENKSYLYEILQYFSEQFELIIQTFGDHSRESVFDDILYYIRHNYNSPLKLGLIAPLFGYSSAYLGKLFLQKTGKTFNAYLNEIRIEQAARLLIDTDMKVYEIATKVGYKKVDHFFQKFRAIQNMSPAEYRKQYRQS